MTIVILGIDLGKNSCSVVGLNESGAVVLRRRMRRQTILGFAAKLPACVVAMEACCGAHYLGRLLTNQGHTVRLLARTHRNIAIVALANKLARIAWAMLKRDRGFALNHGAVAG